MKSIFKHTFILVAFFVVGRVLLERIQHPDLSLHEKIFWTLLLLGFLLFATVCLGFLDQLDEQVWKERSVFK